MSPKKDGIAIPTLFVLVVLVSCKATFSPSISSAILLLCFYSISILTIWSQTYRFTIKSCLKQYNLLQISTTAISLYKPGIRRFLLHFSLTACINQWKLTTKILVSSRFFKDAKISLSVIATICKFVRDIKKSFFMTVAKSLSCLIVEKNFQSSGGGNGMIVHQDLPIWN